MRNHLVLLILILFNVTLLGQQSGFYFGASVGVQYCRILNKQDSEAGDALARRSTFKPMNGFDLGWQFSPAFGIETGILISQQGQKYKYNRNRDSTFSTDLSYMKFPLVLTFKTRTEKKFSLSIQAGAQYNILYRAESGRESGYGPYTSTVSNVRKFFNDQIFEFVLGFGIQYNVSEKINVFAQFRADYSALDILFVNVASRDISRNFTVSCPQLGVHLFL